MLNSVRFLTNASLFACTFLSVRRRWMILWPSNSFSQIIATFKSSIIKLFSHWLTQIPMVGLFFRNLVSVVMTLGFNLVFSSNSNNVSRRPSDSTLKIILPSNPSINSSKGASGAFFWWLTAISGKVRKLRLVLPALSLSVSLFKLILLYWPSDWKSSETGKYRALGVSNGRWMSWRRSS